MPGEEVLVESQCAKHLWNAKVVAVSEQNNKVNGYRVHYTGWSSRYDNWVEPGRVVEATDNNLQVQEERRQEYFAETERGIPKALQCLKAHKFLFSPGRSRGDAQHPNLFRVVNPGPVTSFECSLAFMKASLLLIEAALPQGAVENTTDGFWRPDFALQWRKAVEEADGNYTLMACAYMLEEAIEPEWLRERPVQILSCLPQRWKAIREASAASVGVRIQLLDSAIDYGRFERSNSKKKR